MRSARTERAAGSATDTRRDGGFVIVAVLLLLVALGALAVGMSLETSLATLGARSAQGAAAARSLAHAGIVLALDELSGSAAGGAELMTGGVGPWPALGPGVSGELTIEAGSDPPAYRLVVTAVSGRARAQASAVFVLAPAFRVLEWRE